MKAASSNRKALPSQISRIRETIDQVLNDDTTLADKIKTLFREQGITIASILTALGFIISTLTLTFTGGTRGGTPPSDRVGIKEWIKKHLKALGSALGKLAGKDMSALPGIIGSIVFWLLNLLAKTTTWLSQNLWALIVAIAGLLYISTKNYLTKSVH